jgi:hypothetical protein
LAWILPSHSIRNAAAKGLGVAAHRFFAEPYEFVVKHIRGNEQQQADRKVSLFNVSGRNYPAMLTAARDAMPAR